MYQNRKTILEVRNLSISFQKYYNGLKQKMIPVISHLDFTVYPGEIVAVAGSSGAGKSILAAAILGILPQNAKTEGEIIYKGEILSCEKQKKLRGREIALVPQSVAFLNPLMKTGKQVDRHGGAKIEEKRKKIFQRLALPSNTENLYPFQLSGGMARRVLVSTALISEAQLIIADEPTPGMALFEAKEALRIFREMAEEQKAVILITHDIDLAVEFADRIVIFYGGTTLEEVSVAEFKEGKKGLYHPYSKALWNSLPQNGFQSIPGYQPKVESVGEGCLFVSQCSERTELCEKKFPPMREVGEGKVRCHHVT